MFKVYVQDLKQTQFSFDFLLSNSSNQKQQTKPQDILQSLKFNNYNFMS